MKKKKKSNIGRGCDLYFSMNLMHQIIIGLIPNLDQQPWETAAFIKNQKREELSKQQAL